MLMRWCLSGVRSRAGMSPRGDYIVIMFADFLRRMTVPGPVEPPTAEECREAVAALMVRVARADEKYTTIEQGQIDRLIAERYGLSTSAASQVRAAAETAEAAAPDTVQFTRIVKDVIPYEERSRIVEALWRVAISDGIDAEERGFLRLVVSLLGVSDQESAIARQKAERREGG